MSNDDFQASLERVWEKLTPLRASTENASLLEWQKLSPLTSAATPFGGVLCGVSVYAKRFLGRKPVAEIHIIEDAFDECYRISSWRKGREPILIFPEDCRGAPLYTRCNTALRPSLNELYIEMERIVEILIPLLADGKIKTSYPAEWVGRSSLAILKDALAERRTRR